MSADSNISPDSITANRHAELAAHLRFVAAHSPHYRKHWGPIVGKTADTPLSALPPTDLETYWHSNTPLDSQVLTAPHADGPVFKSGGTTGNPKFSFFSNEDWRTFCTVFGAGMRRGGLQSGERVANLFYGGQLYASFLLIGRAVEEAGGGVQYPLSGAAPADEVIKTLKQFRIGTLAGVPTSLMSLLPALAQAEAGTIHLTRFLYGGEAMFPDQVDALRQVLPGCTVQSIGIAGVDYGEMGWSQPGGEHGVHHCFDESTVLEILDEAGRPLDEPGVSGELLITNFRRRLMPVIRYPVGDRGMWIDPPGTPARRFRVLGRSNNCARVGPVSLYVEDIQNILSQVSAGQAFIGFQMQIDHAAQRDRCTLRIAVSRPQEVASSLTDAICRALAKERPMYSELVDQGVIHPLAVEWVTPNQMASNPRTGKTPRVLDRRLPS